MPLTPPHGDDWPGQPGARPARPSPEMRGPMTLPFPVPHRLFGVEHHFLELGAAQIHYVTAGSGETALLLHGNPSWSFLYRKIIAGLQDEFRCVAPDFPGYGMSTAAPGFSFLPRDQASCWSASSASWALPTSRSWSRTGAAPSAWASPPAGPN